MYSSFFLPAEVVKQLNHTQPHFHPREVLTTPAPCGVKAKLTPLFQRFLNLF